MRLREPADCILAIELTRRRGLASVTCRGEVDLYGAGVLEQALAAAQDLTTPSLEVDLTEVEYIDSCCLQALLQTRKELAREG